MFELFENSISGEMLKSTMSFLALSGMLGLAVFSSMINPLQLVPGSVVDLFYGNERVRDTFLVTVAICLPMLLIIFMDTFNYFYSHDCDDPLKKPTYCLPGLKAAYRIHVKMKSVTIRDNVLFK